MTTERHPVWDDLDGDDATTAQEPTGEAPPRKNPNVTDEDRLRDVAALSGWGYDADAIAVATSDRPGRVGHIVLPGGSTVDLGPCDDTGTTLADALGTYGWEARRVRADDELGMVISIWEADNR